MGNVADDLGYTAAAEELTRAAWAYAVVVDHRPLMAKLRLDLSGFSYWQGQYRRAAELASSGLEYLATGPTGTQLHLRAGRAAIRLGELDDARRAVTAAASAAHGTDYQDDLVAIGSAYDLSKATARALTGSVLMDLPGAAGEAATQLQEASDLYAAGPGPGETHGYMMTAFCRVDLAVAHLRDGELDAATEAMSAVLTLPEGRRINPLAFHLRGVRTELARPAFHGSPQARGLDEQIEEFLQDSLRADATIPGLSG
jgi:tetratricopeptide (TPR) repeat protein